MKILVDQRLGVPAYGLTNAFNGMGHQCVLWDERVKPTFDAFSELEPDLFISTRDSLQNRAIAKNLNSRSQLKAFMVGDVAELLAFDTHSYKIGTKRAELACDVAYVGFFEEWKLQYIIPLIRAGYSVRIFSSQQWPLTEYVGALTVPELPDLYASAKISLNLAQGPDESLFRIIGCGGLCVSTYKDSRYEGYQYWGDTVDRFLGTVDGLLMAGACDKYKKGKALILSQHTYEHQAERILQCCQ